MGYSGISVFLGDINFVPRHVIYYKDVSYCAYLCTFLMDACKDLSNSLLNILYRHENDYDEYLWTFLQYIYCKMTMIHLK